MARSTKLTPELKEQILEKLQETGSDKESFTHVGISSATFYRWQNENQEFRESVAEAKQYYRANCPQILKDLAKHNILDYLQGRAVETWECEEVMYDAGGNITGRKVSSKKVQRPCPQWVIDRILGRDMEEVEALRVLLNVGWLNTDIVDNLGERLARTEDKIKNLLNAKLN